MAGSGRVWATVEFVGAKQKASTHKREMSFVFICLLNTPNSGSLSRQFEVFSGGQAEDKDFTEANKANEEELGAGAALGQWMVDSG